MCQRVCWKQRAWRVAAAIEVFLLPRRWDSPRPRYGTMADWKDTASHGFPVTDLRAGRPDVYPFAVRPSPVEDIVVHATSPYVVVSDLRTHHEVLQTNALRPARSCNCSKLVRRAHAIADARTLRYEVPFSVKMLFFCSMAQPLKTTLVGMYGFLFDNIYIFYNQAMGLVVRLSFQFTKNNDFGARRRVHRVKGVRAQNGASLPVACARMIKIVVQEW